VQSVCSVIPAEFNRQIIEARAGLSEDPLLGAIYDPPFAHFTHQLVEDYDWGGLENALAEFADKHPPFEARSIGLLCATGEDTGITVGVYRSPELVAYHNELWGVILPFAKGRMRKQDEPPTWLPHITIKRCGKHFESFGGAMTRLATRSFVWTMTIDNVAVQHDPANNSQTHYQRLSFPLGGTANKPLVIRLTHTNATIRSLDQVSRPDGAPVWTLRVKEDAGTDHELQMTAPEMVRLMAGCNASSVYFAGGRCHIESGKVLAIRPKTPYPVR
jgi:2'-5' RNA ligase